MAWENSTKFIVKRQFPPESSLSADPQMADLEGGPGEIAWKQPESHEQYPSLYEQPQGGETSVCDMEQRKTADEYNSYHQPSTSGQRGGAD